jgi:hypothetical protein
MKHYCCSRIRTAVFARRLVWTLVAAISVVSIVGCGKGDGSGATLTVNPSAAADKAIKQYDKDGNRSLNEAELAACPGLLVARERYDTDGNREISRDEIANRLQTVFGSGTSWMTVTCTVLQGGRPLNGVNVKFVPESFLEGAIQPATGTTDSNGRVTPAIADDKLPAEKKGLHLMNPGVYRVEVEHPSVKQPHKPLGCEIDEFARGGTDVVISL